MRIELTCIGLLVYLANHYTTRGAQQILIVLNINDSSYVCMYVLSMYLYLPRQNELGVSSLCNGYSDGLGNRSKRVRTPVALLRSLSDEYPWERYEPPYFISL